MSQFFDETGVYPVGSALTVAIVCINRKSECTLCRQTELVVAERGFDPFPAAKELAGEGVPLSALPVARREGFVGYAFLGEGKSLGDLPDFAEECMSGTEKLTAEKERVLSLLPKRLLPWYERNKRDLPWRKDADPYRVWVSEIMLQQTRVETGKAYFERFVRELPSVFSLAACPQEKLMKLWEGLGYYSRAVNLQKTAKIICERYAGVFPSDRKSLEALPGIGAYTAGAILSIAFGQRAAAVDGNVVRVVSRITEDFAPDKAKIAERLERIYPENAGDFTQSLMELGATVCLPNGDPLCLICPMLDECIGRKHAVETLLPPPPVKRERGKRTVYVFRIETKEGIALRKREEKGVLQGMWEFPCADSEKLPREWGVIDPVLIRKRTHRHIFTHLEWDMICFDYRASGLAIPAYSMETIKKEISLPSAFRWIL
ncbi:MAG: A/G-specific adenine glycosylase [Christensenellaceae bacterium]